MRDWYQSKISDAFMSEFFLVAVISVAKCPHLCQRCYILTGYYFFTQV